MSEYRYGVEIEIERHKLIPEDNKYWKIDKDNSLRNGLEFSFRGPYKAKDTLDAVDDFYFNLLDPKSEVSPRTGTHVHFDARYFDADQLKRLSIYYALFEPQVFEWVGEHRARNNFCLPWFVAQGDIPVVAKCFSKKYRPMYAGRINRYAALNLNALEKFGSVEWRHLLTSKKSDKLLDWIKIITHFGDLSCEETSCKHLVEDYRTDPLKVFRKAFGALELLPEPQSIHEAGVLISLDLLREGAKEKAPPAKKDEEFGLRAGDLPLWARQVNVPAAPRRRRVPRLEIDPQWNVAVAEGVLNDPEPPPEPIGLGDAVPAPGEQWWNNAPIPEPDRADFERMNLAALEHDRQMRELEVRRIQQEVMAARNRALWQALDNVEMRVAQVQVNNEEDEVNF